MQGAVKFRFSIFYKILVTMLFVAIVPLVAIWFVNYQTASKHLTQNVQQRLGGISDKLAATVNDWVSANHKVLLQNGALPDMASMNPRVQNPVLRSVLNEYGWSYLVFTIRPDGMNVGRSDGKETISYADRVYFKQVMEGAPLGKQVVISKTTGKPSLILSAPIHGPGRQLAGVIAMGTSLTDISETITKSSIGSTGFAFLLDEDGKVVAHQKQEYTNTMADLSKHPAFLGRSAETARLVTFDDNGRKVIAHARKTKQGWTLVAQQDHDEAFSALSEANRNALILLAITLLTVSYVAYLLAQRLSRPIRHLTAVADEISRGQLDIKIEELNRRDEIGALAAAIDRMGVSIRMSLQKLRARA
jgi:methyl-accepting chemotaxis protein